jgi:metallo-beta-lactamase family protein
LHSQPSSFLVPALASVADCQLPQHHTERLSASRAARRLPGATDLDVWPHGDYVELDEKYYKIEARITIIAGYSTCVDQQESMDFVTQMHQRPSDICIVPGDLEAKHALSEHYLYFLYFIEFNAGI